MKNPNDFMSNHTTMMVATNVFFVSIFPTPNITILYQENTIYTHKENYLKIPHKTISSIMFPKHQVKGKTYIVLYSKKKKKDKTKECKSFFSFKL
jgi:hypothetical protein